MAAVLERAVKPVRIRLVPDTRWFYVWAATALICGGILGLAAWQWQRNAQAAHAIEQEIAHIKKKAGEIEAAQKVPEAVLRREQAIAKLLQLDLNKVFAVIENIAVPGTRLRRVEMDAPANSLRVEYELESLGQAVEITAALNAGYERGPWRLGNVAAVGGAQPVGAAAHKFQGTWSAPIDRL